MPFGLPRGADVTSPRCRGIHGRMSACPVCTFPLRDVNHQGTALKLCRRCGGTWLEAHRLKEAFGGLGAPSSWNADELQEGPEVRHLRCPADGHRMNALRVVAPHGSVVVDHCQACGGLWLDALEGDQLARLLRTGVETGEPPPGVADRKPGWRSYFFQLFTGLPIEVWHPVKKTPLVVYSLVAVLTVAFVLELVVMAQDGMAGSSALATTLALTPTTFLSGIAPWTVVTHGFIHGGVLHLLGNLYFLWIFGDNVEDTLGRRRMLWVYAAALVVGGLAEVVSAPSSGIPRLGASGAVAGLMGAYMALFPHVKVWVVMLFMRFKMSVWIYLGLWVAVQVLSAMAHRTGVAWFAHLGGFGTGMVLGLMFRSSVPQRGAWKT